jgi:hypothetical protein
MIQTINYDEIVTEESSKDAYVNTEFKGFNYDYLVIHSLIKKWLPNVIFEIGTNVGNGCRVMKTASPDSKIYTLDIRSCGEFCPTDVTKIVGDSLNFDYTAYYPIDCWFIDGYHTYDNVYKETGHAIASGAKYIIYHDSDLDEIYNGIKDYFTNTNNNDYELRRVINPPEEYCDNKGLTRILYAIKK